MGWNGFGVGRQVPSQVDFWDPFTLLFQRALSSIISYYLRVHAYCTYISWGDERIFQHHMR